MPGAPDRTVDLLTIGEAFDDLVMAGLTRLPRLGEELRVERVSHHPGGGAIITVIAASRLGVRAATITAASASTAAALHRETVALTDLRRRHEPAALTVALSTARDRALVTFDAVNRSLETRLPRGLAGLRRLPRHAHFALGPRRCSRWVPVLKRLRSRGVTTSWDFGWHERLIHDTHFERLLAELDWVFVNDREAALYARTRGLRSALARWRRLSPGTVIKRGARGALAVTQDGVVRAPAVRVRAVDTTGAGDAFNAGFLAAILTGSSTQDALRLGNYVGAQSTRAVGGVDGLPALARLPQWARRLVEGA
jgi:sugar/nucleoside kinase (ribokinase family)